VQTNQVRHHTDHIRRRELWQNTTQPRARRTLPAATGQPHYCCKPGSAFQAQGTCEDTEPVEGQICQCQWWQSREQVGAQWPTLSVQKTWTTELAVPCPWKPDPAKPISTAW